MSIEELRNVKSNGNFHEGEYIFRDLLNVGKTKALGYLPLSTITECGKGTSLSSLIIWACHNNLDYEMYTHGHTGSGALYIWSNNQLEEILIKNKEVLIKAGVPITPKEYVHHIEHNVVFSQVYPDAYIAIGKTFNDRRFRNKTTKA